MRKDKKTGFLPASHITNGRIYSEGSLGETLKAAVQIAKRNRRKLKRDADFEEAVLSGKAGEAMRTEEKGNDPFEEVMELIKDLEIEKDEGLTSKVLLHKLAVRDAALDQIRSLTSRTLYHPTFPSREEFAMELDKILEDVKVQDSRGVETLTCYSVRKAQDSLIITDNITKDEKNSNIAFNDHCTATGKARGIEITYFGTKLCFANIPELVNCLQLADQYKKEVESLKVEMNTLKTNISHILNVEDK